MFIYLSSADAAPTSAGILFERAAGAVKANPDDGLARKIWAAELAQQGRFRDAVNQYVAAVELEPDDAALHSELAAAYLKLDRPDYARQQWKQVEDVAGAAPDDAS